MEKRSEFYIDVVYSEIIHINSVKNIFIFQKFIIAAELSQQNI